MKINGNQVRIGNVIEHKGSLWIVTKAQAVKPGKGGAFNQLELKSLQDNTKLNERFRADEIVEKVRIDSEEYQYLYANNAEVVFMNNETYEQVVIDEILISEKKSLLKEGMIVQIELYDGKPIGVIFPETVILRVIETEPTIKGQTAASSSKPAILENDLRVMVPPFVNNDELIVLDTNDLSYVKRAE
tara:strand:- start:17589 stop:18152 length:564 start_codon:yes stop_codon:yes gene_type:complete